MSKEIENPRELLDLLKQASAYVHYCAEATRYGDAAYKLHSKIREAIKRAEKYD